MNNATDLLIPIAGTNYVILYQEWGKKRKFNHSNTTLKSTNLIMIESVLNNNLLKFNPREKIYLFLNSILNVSVLLPSDFIYSKQEIVDIISKCKNSPIIRSQLISDQANRKIIPITRTDFYILLNQHEVGEIDIYIPWGKRADLHY